MYAESSFAMGKDATVNFVVTLSEIEYPQSGIGLLQWVTERGLTSLTIRML